MARPWLRRGHRARLDLAVGIALLLIGEALLPALAATPASAPAPRLNDGPILGAVTWNGRNVSTAATDASPLSVSFGGVVDVHYTWTVRSAGNGEMATISDARLEMVYFGAALSTRDQVASVPVVASNGSFDMAWDPGLLRYVLAGNYQLIASLLAPNGTTMWSESFFVHENAPYEVLAALPTLLVVLLLYEFYAVAVTGRKAKRPPAQPWQSAASPGASGPEDAANREGDGPSNGPGSGG